MGIIILLVVLAGGLVLLLFVMAVLVSLAQKAQQQRLDVLSNRGRKFPPSRYTLYNGRYSTPVGSSYTPQRLGAEFNWERGSIVNAGFNKDCMVADVKTVPVLHYYLYTVRGREITFFPHKGVRSGWVDEY
ncbi:hypothetical protein [Candidatus Avelusimicrobium stercoris]|uniref:hypothetical protein n=1 Tax=Candidatus Avelusimicrobium stercoris TaxID=1947924 RepID=UPI003D12181A